MSAIDLDAARARARVANDRAGSLAPATRSDVPDLAALVLAMAEELERARPVFEAAIARHKAYFGPTAKRAAKHKATMDLNKATNRARGEI